MALAMILVLMTWSPARQPASAQRLPGQFSRLYVESLRDVLDLTEADAAGLEQQLAVNPDDFPARVKLRAYHQRGDRSGRLEDRAKRLRHVLWLIEHHPDSELLHSPVSRFSPGQISPADYQQAIPLWDAAAKAQLRNAAVQWNPASSDEGV